MRLDELAERTADRLAEIKYLMEILSESSGSEISDALLRQTGSMYRRLSDLYEEIIKAEKTEKRR